MADLKDIRSARHKMAPLKTIMGMTNVPYPTAAIPMEAAMTQSKTMAAMTDVVDSRKALAAPDGLAPLKTVIQVRNINHQTQSTTTHTQDATASPIPTPVMRISAGAGCKWPISKRRCSA